MNRLDYDKFDGDDIPISYIDHGIEYTLYIGLILIMLVIMYMGLEVN